MTDGHSRIYSEAIRGIKLNFAEMSVCLWVMCFHCYANLSFHWLIMGKEKIGF